MTTNNLTTVFPNEEVLNIFTKLKHGDRALKVPKHRDFVMVLGNTGSGKSTFVQFLLGNNDELLSKEITTGTNDFIIVDDSGKISANTTIISKTEIPDLVFDEFTNTAYYDCPGFSDTRSSDHDIAQTYLVRKVIQSARNVKFLFLVNHSSVRQGVDRLDFMLLTKHVTTLIKNIDKYVDSIGLIVSKVDNITEMSENGTLTLVSDDSILNGVVEFIRNVKQDIQGRLSSSTVADDRHFYANAIKFFEALTKQKICLFRRPNMAGLVSKIATMQGGKRKMREMISKELTFTEQMLNDFGFAISDGSKNNVKNLVLELQIKIEMELEAVAAGIKEQYQIKERYTNDLDRLESIFKLAAEQLDAIESNIMSPKEFVKQMLETSQKLDFSIPAANLNDILNYEKYIEFMNTFVDKEEFSYRYVHWNRHAPRLLRYVHDTLKWYRFLQNLYKKISLYSVQREKVTVVDISQVNHITDLKKLNISQLNEYLKDVDVERVKLNETKRKFLRSVMQANLNQTQITKNGKHIVVKGHHVVLSHIADDLISSDYLHINIFAIETIFIDANLNLTGNPPPTLSLIAHKWQVIQNKTITLNGEDGAGQVKAENGTNCSEDGAQGLAGEPGGSSGSFLGILKIFGKTGRLLVESIGGNGGPGQEGGNGGSGVVKQDDFTPHEIASPMVAQLGTIDSAVKELLSISTCFAGSGGNGGEGGMGGNGVNVTLKIFNGFDESRITLTAKDGKRGSPGEGGKAGKPNPKKKARRGLKGVASKLVQKPSIAYAIKHGDVINSYKQYIRNYPHRTMRTAYFQDFIDKLEHNHDVNMLYEAKDFVEELKNLEDIDHAQHNDPQAYNHLLLNIERFSQSNELSGDSKKVLNYLYTATLSCLFRINKRMENNMILDVVIYLKTVMGQIRQFRESGSAKKVNTFSDHYVQSINIKIHEAQKLIDEDINPERDRILDKIDHTIKLLLRQIDASKITVRMQIAKSKNQKQDLENALTMRMLFGGVKLASQFLNFLGPIGSAASALIQGTAVVVEALTLDGSPQISQSSTSELTQRIEKSLELFTNVIKNKQAMLESQLNEISRNIADVGDVTNLRDVVASAQQRIKVPISVKLIDEIQNNVYNALLQLKQSSKATNSKALETISYFQNVIKVGQVSQEIYGSIKNETHKINAVGDVIRQMDQKVNDLIKFDNEIYEVISKSLTNLQSNVVKLSQASNSASLDVQNWKIQSTLMELKLHFRTITQRFGINDEMTVYLEKLQESMSVTVSLFDRIQSNKEKAKLAAYLRDINSSKDQLTVVDDRKVNNALVDLQHRINSNLVLIEYEKVINAIKQYVFPFAHDFLNGYSIPQSLVIQNSTDDVAKNVADKLEELSSKLDRSKVIINKYDKHIRRNIEFRDSKPSSPFFVWRSYSHKPSISKLLNGQEVTFRADILTGVQHNAVKFKQIGVHFKILEGDARVQSELHQQLKHFEVRMIHGGLSYYRCHNKFYVINSEAQTISYSLDENGQPNRTNVVYEKIRDNDYMLSPFALWKIKLVRINGNLGNLSRFRNNTIDLHLEGLGQYVSSEANICDDDLKKYYAIDESISEMNEIDLLQQDLQEMLMVDDGRQHSSKLRKKRNVLEYDYVANSANSNQKSSIIGNFINWFSNPFEHFTRWLQNLNKHEQLGHDLVLNLYETHSCSFNNSIGQLLAENNTVTDMSMAFSKTNIHHNLLLLNLLSRQKFRTKIITDNEICRFPNDEIANQMAYKAYFDSNQK